MNDYSEYAFHKKLTKFHSKTLSGEDLKYAVEADVSLVIANTEACNEREGFDLTFDEYIEQANCSLIGLFTWAHTPEGPEYWMARNKA